MTPGLLKENRKNSLKDQLNGYVKVSTLVWTRFSNTEIFIIVSCLLHFISFGPWKILQRLISWLQLMNMPHN